MAEAGGMHGVRSPPRRVAGVSIDPVAYPELCFRRSQMRMMRKLSPCLRLCWGGKTKLTALHFG